MIKEIKIIPDKPKCNCGVFGIFGDQPDAALHTYFGLHALQHRGQEASGIISAEIYNSGSVNFKIHKNLGLVSEVFTREKLF